jgi:hypothetical protein
MVEGLTIFRDRSRGLDDCYVLIGGTARDFWLVAPAFEFRAAKDLDMLLVVVPPSGRSLHLYPVSRDATPAASRAHPGAAK